MFYTPALRRSVFAPAFSSLDPRFERFIGASHASAACSPRSAKATQDDKGWTLVLDMPGIGREHLRVDIDDTVVRVETLADAPRSYRAAWEFPQAIDAETSEAKLEHGVLTLKLARQMPVSTARQINVQ